MPALSSIVDLFIEKKMAATSINAPVSLVIPAYNRADLICQTLETALAQTVGFSEIIVVDDGSTDNTCEILVQYGSKIRYIKTSNRGVQAARNTGVAAASSELIVLCDSDDLLENRFVEKMSGWMHSHATTDVAYCNFVTFNKKTISAEKLALAPVDFFSGCVRTGDFAFNIPDLYKKIINFQPLFLTGIIFRKIFFEKIGGFDLAFKGVGAEDWEFTLRSISQGNAAICLTPLVRIRKHDGNDSQDEVRMRLGEVKILEHGLAHHAGAARYREQILVSINARLLDVFNSAFTRGDFELLTATLRRLESGPKGFKFHLKRAICGLPPLIRQRLWVVSQRNRIAVPSEK